MAVPGGLIESLDDIPPHVWRGLPDQMRLRPSAVNQNRIGVWATKCIPKGKRFGPFIGERKKRSQVTSNVYMWEVYFPTRGWMCVDATDPMKGNWLRYVNWARSSEEQNLFPLEINRSIYYKVLRPIEPDEELLVWYNGEDNPEIAAALEEERASSLSKKNSPRAKRARKKLFEKAQQGSKQSSQTKPVITEMRESQEGLNEEDEKPSPSEGQVQVPVLSHMTSSTNSKDPSSPQLSSAEAGQENGEESEQGEMQLPSSQESQQCTAESVQVDKNGDSDQQLIQNSPVEEVCASPLSETECESSLLKREVDADPDFEDDTQGGTHRCQHCERHFSTKQGLERHTHIHTTANHQTHNFKCRYCAKPFGSQVGRRRHERRHENGLKRPGALAGTAMFRSPSVFIESSPSVGVTSPSHIIMGSQNGASPRSSDVLKKDTGAESDRPSVLDESGESKELHPCKYCNKAFGTHTNMRRHQRRIHERHLMPKGVSRKGMLLQEVRSQQQGLEHATPNQEASPSVSPPPTYVPSVDTEDEGEREEFMVDVSNNISENLSLYIDGKILPTNTGSSCEVIEVDSGSAALFGLDAVIISPEQMSQTLKCETRGSPLRDVSVVGQSGSKRRTTTPPLLPNVKIESETMSSTASLSSTSSQPPLVVGNIFNQSTETLAFPKEKTIYLSPKLKQLLQTQDTQKPTIALIAESHKLATPLSVSSLPAASGRFKRRTTSPPTSTQSSSSLKTEGSSSETGVLLLQQVPRIEGQSVSSAWSLSNKDQDTTSLSGKEMFKEWSVSRSGGNSCNQQPLDLSNAVSKRNSNISKGPGESVLDLSLHRKNVVDHEAKGSPTLHPHTKKKKPNTSMLEKVLMNEYTGLNPAGERSSPALGSPDGNSSSNITGVSPSSPSSSSDRLPYETTPPSPPSLTPVTMNPSSPSSSSRASPTPPPPVLPTVPSPPTLSSQPAQTSDSSVLCSLPELSPKMFSSHFEHELEMSESSKCDANIVESCPDAMNPSHSELGQTAEQLEPSTHSLLSSPQDTTRHSKSDSLSKPETLTQGPSSDSKSSVLESKHYATSSHSEANLNSTTSERDIPCKILSQDLGNTNEELLKSKSSLSPVQLSPQNESPLVTLNSAAADSDCQQSQIVSNIEETGRKEEPVDIEINTNGHLPSSLSVYPVKTSSEEMSEQETFAKNFVCNVCEDPFRSISELSQHIMKHSVEWPFKCEFCVQLFRNTSALLEHRSTLHGVGRIYVCSVCSKEFAFLCNLLQHQKDLHPDQGCSHTVVENGKLRPQNYTDPAQANLESNPSNAAADSAAEAVSQNTVGDHDKNDANEEDGEEGKEDPTEELYTTIKIMASEAGKPKGPDVRLGINQHYPSFKPPPFPYHNRTPAGSVASATNFTTHNIPQTFTTAIRCTKCGKSFDNMPELHKHILACANASDKRRYTPKKNPIPLRQIVKPQNGVFSPIGNASAGQNAFRRMGQPKRLNFGQEMSSKVKMTALNKKKNKLVQKAISQKNKTTASARKAASQTEEQQDVHVCPHCSREFTYPASLSKHIACSCPMKPVSKKSKKVMAISHDKNMNLRSRVTDTDVKQEHEAGLNVKTLGKTRARSLESVQSESKGKPILSQARIKRLASNSDGTVPLSKKSKKNNTQPSTQSLTTSPLDDSLQRPTMRMQRMGKEVTPKKVVEVKSQQQPEVQPKKEGRFSLRTRERVGGPVTRSLQMASASASVEVVKTEDLSNHEQQ
ncbi:PR domain zinc finger protein 2 [Chanos chanos]|uniref:PR domain zinc finger protein 2 n=1 Tax=Chanos chanos TaxID=29144 RepID=A0A6J2VQS2_CHACN|nr:PR domain zinc finger protein 2 [Chanos chanos]